MKESKRHILEHLPFEKAGSFFDIFLLEGKNTNWLGLEINPRIIEAAGFCICIEGEGEVIIESRSYLLKKGDMCVLMPNDILYIKRKSLNFKGYTVTCSSDFYNSFYVPYGAVLYLYIKDNPCISLKPEDEKGLIGMCENLKEHDSRENRPFQEEISSHLAYAVFYEVLSIYKKGEPLKQQPYSRKNKLYLEFVELLTKNCRKERGIEFYADKLCITSKHLFSICKEITGQTAKECLNEHIIMQIKILLSTTDMTIAQISDELNFPNASFFTKFFKQKTGMTPKEYRNNAAT